MRIERNFSRCGEPRECVVRRQPMDDAPERRVIRELNYQKSAAFRTAVHRALALAERARLDVRVDSDEETFGDIRLIAPGGWMAEEQLRGLADLMMSAERVRALPEADGRVCWEFRFDLCDEIGEELYR